MTELRPSQIGLQRAGAQVKAGTEEFVYDISEDPESFYKFAVVTRNNHLTCWSPK